MSAISSAGVSVPAERLRLVVAGEGGEEVPREAWPVLDSPSWRALRPSSTQLLSTPSSTSASFAVRVPSPSNGRLRRPRGRHGSSVTRRPRGRMRVPMRSLRNEVPRATDAPLSAPARWESRLPETRGS